MEVSLVEVAFDTYLGDGELFAVVIVCRLVNRILFTIQ